MEAKQSVAVAYRMGRELAIIMAGGFMYCCTCIVKRSGRRIIIHSHVNLFVINNHDSVTIFKNLLLYLVTVSCGRMVRRIRSRFRVL